MSGRLLKYTLVQCRRSSSSADSDNKDVNFYIVLNVIFSTVFPLFRPNGHQQASDGVAHNQLALRHPVPVQIGGAFRRRHGIAQLGGHPNMPEALHLNGDFYKIYLKNY